MFFPTALLRDEAGLSHALDHGVDWWSVGKLELTSGVVARPFFLAVFFRFTHDALSEKGTTRSPRLT